MTSYELARLLRRLKGNNRYAVLLYARLLLFREILSDQYNRERVYQYPAHWIR